MWQSVPLPTQPVLAYLAEELPVPLHASEGAHAQDTGAIDGEEGADGVELRGEDLEDDEGEAELGDGGAEVGAFECALRRSDLAEKDELTSEEPLWRGILPRPAQRTRG